MEENKDIDLTIDLEPQLTNEDLKQTSYESDGE